MTLHHPPDAVGLSRGDIRFDFWSFGIGLIQDKP